MYKRTRMSPVLSVEKLDTGAPFWRKFEKRKKNKYMVHGIEPEGTG
ncbi:MAG: hypothetical protein ACP5FU_06800 [Nitrososphaeria archaeon]